jgi:predicted PhzF superfamily epimerase YddE/YHI9
VRIAWPDRPAFAGALPIDAVYDALNIPLSNRETDLPISIYNSGNRNAIVPVRTAAALETVRPDWIKLEALFEEFQLTDLHLYLLLRPLSSADQIHVRCRNFFPYGIFEEAATGTASLSLAAALMDQPLFKPSAMPTEFVFVQGSGTRYGRLYVSWPPADARTTPAWLSGRVFLVAKGEIAIPKSK